MWPVPNSRPETVVPPRKCWSCIARFTFENREPPCSGAKPPRLNSLKRPSPKRPASTGPTRDGNGHTVPGEANLPSPSPRPSRNRTRGHRRIRRTKHKPAPRSVGKTGSVGRTGPPTPASADIHPAAVVIRRPAPIVVRNPGPAPIRLVHPAAIAIRSLPVRDPVLLPALICAVRRRQAVPSLDLRPA